MRPRAALTCNYVVAGARQAVPDRTMAFKMVNNFRIQATSATRPGLPASFRRFQNF